LNNTVSGFVGSTFGIPWKEGDLLREESLALRHAGSEEMVAMQSWPTAYWPDGSVKWSAHASAPLTPAPNGYDVVKGEGAVSACSVTVKETDEAIELDTGVITLVVRKHGDKVIDRIIRNGAVLCSGGTLVSVKEGRSSVSGINTVREESFKCIIHKATVEQSGPVRAVVKLEGKHRSDSGSREWLPISMRLYVYAGLDTVRFVHSFHYDGNPNSDFIKALGITFTVPMRGPLYNRHVRFAGDSGFFSESPKTLHTRRTKSKYRELFEKQTKGESVNFDEADDRYFVGLLDDSAVWDDFKLVQRSADHYGVWKRTKADCCWIKAAEGRRAGGLGYVGSEIGGLAAGLRNFWEKHPSGLEIGETAKQEAKLTVWFWSPDGDAMDLRHYDTETHVESSYEGAEEMRATPYGIANTSELTLWCTAETPSPLRLQAMQEQTASRRCSFASQATCMRRVHLAYGDCRIGASQ
jgi:hypothetical protein